MWLEKGAMTPISTIAPIILRRITKSNRIAEVVGEAEHIIASYRPRH
jgi:hypothetical protein